MSRLSKHKIKQAERGSKLSEARKAKRNIISESEQGEIRPGSSLETNGDLLGTEMGTLSIRNRLLQDHFTDDECIKHDENNIKVTISASRIQKLFEITAGVCGECSGKMLLQLRTKNADVDIRVVCKVCESLLYQDDSERLHDRFHVNTTSFVYNSIHNGTGYSGYKDNSASLKLKPLSIEGYYSVQKFIGKKILEVNEERRHIVKDCVFKHYESMGKSSNSDGILDVMVSYDGSWSRMTQGQKSHVGLGCVIEADTGFILDFEVLSDFCVQCTRIETQRKVTKITPGKYQALKAQHKPHCQQNFSGKSGAMEAEAVIRMWNRSVEKNKMRYTTFIGDGDSSSYNAVTSMRDGKGPYDVPVRKEVCVNDVSKLECLLGSKIWHRLLKIKFYGLNTVMYGVALTVLEHNFGNERTDILSELGFQSKTVQKKVAIYKDITKKRKSLESSKPRKKRVCKEDDQNYGDGQF